MLNFAPKSKPTSWVKLGTVSVDSGQILITDPCYIEKDFQQDFSEESQNPMNLENLPLNYNGVCKRTLQQKPWGNVNLSFACVSGFGDGTYNVYGKIEAGRVKELKIKFF